MLTLQSCHLGYCHNCKRAAPVGTFIVDQWRHTFDICGNCLSAYSSRVDGDVSKQLMDEEKKKNSGG
jgi:hypothetical protein